MTVLAQRDRLITVFLCAVQCSYSIHLLLCFLCFLSACLTDYFSLACSILPPFVPTFSLLNLSSPILVFRHPITFLFFPCLPYTALPAIDIQYIHTVNSIKNNGRYFTPFPPYFSPSSSLIVPLLSLVTLPHSQVSWMQTGSSRPERGEEVLERKEEERKGVASLGYQQQLSCQSQPQAPPLSFPLPHHPPPRDGGEGGRGRGR